MIGDSAAEYVWVVTWVVILNSIGPTCAIYSVFAPLLPQRLQLPWYLMLWPLSETVFYLLIYLYRKHHLQRPASHPAARTKEERGKLFDLCLETTHDHEEYISKWFLHAPFSSIRKENIKEFFRWAFLDTGSDDPKDDDELEMYVAKLEEKNPGKVRGWQKQRQESTIDT